MLMCIPESRERIEQVLFQRNIFINIMKELIIEILEVGTIKRVGHLP